MSDDVIRRGDAIKAIFSKPACHGSDGSWYHSDDIRDAINSTPSTDRPQGEWIMSDIQSKEDTDNGNYQYTCSVCGHGDIHARTQEVPYCWWCGARMK